jgi:DNA repair protein RecN (Recombination protein N)
MIERFYLKDYLSFEEVELNLYNGLVVFTGPSGSGKSILIESILSSLGVSSCEASLCESSVGWDINLDALGIHSDEINILKHIKKEKSRYFINNQCLSKQAMSGIASKYLRHLSLKDFSDFENENLLSILDNRAGLKSKRIFKLLNKYKAVHKDYVEIKKEL